MSSNHPPPRPPRKPKCSEPTDISGRNNRLSQFPDDISVLSLSLSDDEFSFDLQSATEDDWSHLPMAEEVYFEDDEPNQHADSTDIYGIPMEREDDVGDSEWREEAEEVIFDDDFADGQVVREDGEEAHMDREICSTHQVRHFRCKRVSSDDKKRVWLHWREQTL